MAIICHDSHVRKMLDEENDPISDVIRSLYVALQSDGVSREERAILGVIRKEMRFFDYATYRELRNQGRPVTYKVESEDMTAKLLWAATYSLVTARDRFINDFIGG